MRPAIRPKKSLGQHFLHDRRIAARIVESLPIASKDTCVLEIGPGTGILTGFLQDKPVNLKMVEIDPVAIEHLYKTFPLLADRLIGADVLTLDLGNLFDGHTFSVIGNFPYNISSQIFFRILEFRTKVTQVVCMLQKEVADRIAASHGNKTYGILSVLLQAYYTVEFLFKVGPGAFQPPPRVTSAVVRLTRKRTHLGCDEEAFFRIVKQGFNNRRKTLRNALKRFELSAESLADPVFDLRAEQLSVEDFVKLTLRIGGDLPAVHR